MGGKIVTNKGLLKELLLSTLVAFAVSYLIHLLKVQLETPDQEPDAQTCQQLSSLASSPTGAATHFDSLSKFYPFYLCEHSHKFTKLFHFVGTFNVGVMMLKFADSGLNPKFAVLGIVQAYTFAWLSHFFIEHNKPATFQYPLYSLTSDFILFKDLAFGAFKMW